LELRGGGIRLKNQLRKMDDDECQVPVAVREWRCPL
jgi:hypothetical protein